MARLVGTGVWLAWSVGCALPFMSPPPGDMSRMEAGVWGGAGQVHTVDVHAYPGSGSGCAGSSEWVRWREQRQPAFGEMWGRLWFTPRARVSPGLLVGVGGAALWRSASSPIGKTFWEVVPAARLGLAVRVRDREGGMVMLEGGVLVLGPPPSLPDSLLSPAVRFRLVPWTPWIPYGTAQMRLPLAGGRIHVYPIFYPPGFGGIAWNLPRGRLFLFFMPPFFEVEEEDNNSLAYLWRRGMLVGGVSADFP